MSDTSTVTLLRDVRAKIEAGWVQNIPARISDGRGALATDPRAVCWCLSGAAVACERNEADLAHALGFVLTVHMIRWNDEIGRTQAEVLARIDTAIARAEGRSGIGGGA